MVSIVDEKRINLSLSQYKLSDGNIVDTTWVKQNIHLVDNAKIYQNGKIAWGILTSDTEENKFYASLCNIYYRLGCDLRVIKNIFTKYEQLNKLIQPSKQEEKFMVNLYNIIQMFFSYMTDTNYIFCKIRCKKTFALGSKDDLIHLRESIEHKTFGSVDSVFSTIGFTFLGDCLYSIYLFNLCNRLCRHKDEKLQFLITNEVTRKQMLDNYLVSYVKDYKAFQKKVLAKRRFIGRNLETYSQDVNLVLSKLNDSYHINNFTYTEKLEDCIRHCNMLSELLLGNSSKDTDNKSEFMNSAIELSGSVALATGNVTARCGTAFVKFFTNLYDNYKKVKLPKNVYAFINSLDKNLQNYDIDILVFLLEQRTYILSKRRKKEYNYYYNTYSIPYLWIIFDFSTFDRYRMKGTFISGYRDSDTTDFLLTLNESVILSWLSAYIYINMNLSNEIDSNNLISSIFGKVNEDLYLIARQYFEYKSSIRIETVSKMYDTMYDHCNRDFGYSFKHSSFLTEAQMLKLTKNA